MCTMRPPSASPNFSTGLLYNGACVTLETIVSDPFPTLKQIRLMQRDCIFLTRQSVALCRSFDQNTDILLS
jgi:hypothetical protein